MEIPTRYNAEEIETKWYEIWLKKGLFQADPQRVLREGKKPYSVMMPPPNVTGIVHLGHILNNTIQDLFVRFKKMEGYEVLWQPGTDHAGIATQNVVERELALRGKTRFDLGREELLKIIWEWKNKSEREIIDRLKRLGIACDWSKYKFTLDPDMSYAVKFAFHKLYLDGLIYKGKYMINWCPSCGTALADDEVEYVENTGNLYYIKYPLEDEKGYIVVATTRPETYLGDTAVAVNPKDERYKKYIGKRVKLPLVYWEREGETPTGEKVKVSPLIPIISDPRVSMEFGTGALKITPAHDPIDFEIGNAYDLPRVIVLDREAKTNENAGIFRGLDRYKARERIVEELRENGYLEKVEDYLHSVGTCYRCGSVIEPYISEEWFVRMKPLGEPAIYVVERGDVEIIPEYAKKIYFNWLLNVKDWCISRKIWWGHKIPFYQCLRCGYSFTSSDDPEVCPECKSLELKGEDDVLDTWFSSWLWPISTLGWPKNTELIKAFYPTDILVTGWDILFFWVARMIMAGLYFLKMVPFRYVYLHGIVRDEKRRKISKSLGNYVDPIEYIRKYGADGTRMGLLLIVPEGQDVILSEKRLEIGRNFATKIWNASRFLLMQRELLGDEDFDNLRLEDRWILTRLNRTIDSLRDNLNKVEVNRSAQEIYHFVWDDFCDWYIEIIKLRIQEKIQENKAVFLGFYVMERILRLLHPFMPFVTEELWQLLKVSKEEFVINSRYPENDGHIYPKEEEIFEEFKRLINQVREIRSFYKISPKDELRINFSSVEENLKKFLLDNQYLLKLAKISEVDVQGLSKGVPYVPIYVRGSVFQLPLRDIDYEKEKERILKEIGELEQVIEKIKKNLKDPEYLDKAPAWVVEKDREKLNELGKKIEVLKSFLLGLEGGNG